MKESEHNALVEEIVNTSNQQLRDKVNHAIGAAGLFVVGHVVHLLSG